MPLSALHPAVSLAADTSQDHHGGGHSLILLLIVGAIVYAVGYAISIRVHPYKPCPRCKGSGRHRGAWFRDSFRACDRCGGQGREYRAFAHRPYAQNERKRRGRR